MQTYPMKLVTIICEAHARDAVTKLLHDVGAHGWTSFSVEGDGARGRRTADIPEFTNVQIEAIVSPAVAEQLMERLGRDFSPSMEWLRSSRTCGCCEKTSFSPMRLHPELHGLRW